MRGCECHDGKEAEFTAERGERCLRLMANMRGCVRGLNAMMCMRGYECRDGEEAAQVNAVCACGRGCE